MSKRQFAIRSAFVAVATALAAGGVLTPLPAQATPAFPLAPACEKWSYPTHAFLLNQDNGILVALYLSDNQYFEGPASHTVAGKPDVTGGKVVGNLRGNYMEFNVDWLNGVTNFYYGSIEDDGFARGTTQNNRERNNWTSQSKFTCVSSAPAPFEPPPGVVQLPKDPGAVVADPPAGQTPAKPSVTVLQGSNVYDAPEGNRIGGDDFFLNDGEKYDLVAPCANDWCHLVIPAVPGGKGFVCQGNEQEGFFLKVN